MRILRNPLGISGAPHLICASGLYCKAQPGACSGAGVCTAKPKGCNLVMAPVCGCDGKNYPNGCAAAVAGQNVKSKGTCGGGVVKVCDDGNPCTKDSCDAKKGCQASPLADKTLCSGDGKKWCLTGKCTARSCGDGKIDVVLLGRETIYRDQQQVA